MDHDKNQTLLRKSGCEKLNIKDYFIFKQFDKAISALIEAQKYLSTVQNDLLSKD